LRTQAEHYNYAGTCHQEMGQLEEALKHYDIAVKKDPSNGTYYYNRGIVKSKLEKLEEAVEDYNKALEYIIETQLQFNTKFSKGICLRRLGKLDASIKELQEAVSLKGDKASAHNNLGLSYFEREDFEEALNSFTKAI